MYKTSLFEKKFKKISKNFKKVSKMVWIWKRIRNRKRIKNERKCTCGALILFFDFLKFKTSTSLRLSRGRALHTDSILECCCRDCISPIWTLNIALYAEFSRNVAWRILVWIALITATPGVPDGKWPSLTRQVWPKCLPMVCSLFHKCVAEFANKHFSESRTMKDLQNYTSLRHLVLSLCSEKK